MRNPAASDYTCHLTLPATRASPYRLRDTHSVCVMTAARNALAWQRQKSSQTRIPMSNCPATFSRFTIFRRGCSFDPINGPSGDYVPLLTGGGNPFYLLAAPVISSPSARAN